MVSVEDILRAAKPSLTNFANNYADLLSSNINKVFRSEALPALRNEYILEYDRLADIVEGLTPSAIQGKDPLSLKKQRELFINNLDSQIAKAVIDENGLSLNLVLTGREDARGTPTTPDSLNHYLEGFIGEAAFITPEHKKSHPAKRNDRRALGRVGGGFLIERVDYEKERWQEATRISFNDIRHPISGFSPYRGFEKVPSRVDFGAFVRKGIEITNSIVNGAGL